MQTIPDREWPIARYLGFYARAHMIDAKQNSVEERATVIRESIQALGKRTGDHDPVGQYIDLSRIEINCDYLSGVKLINVDFKSSIFYGRANKTTKGQLIACRIKSAVIDDSDGDCSLENKNILCYQCDGETITKTKRDHQRKEKKHQ